MSRSRIPAVLVGTRFAGVCGLLAFVTFNVGWIAADLAQPPAFSPTHNDISDLGALTANSPWLYNQLAANCSGLLAIALGIGLWRALSPNLVGRVGAAALIATGVGTFLDGIFRLDCQPIDARCSNDSWHSHAHKIESSFTLGATFLALLILAVALRRIPNWRDTWLPILSALHASSSRTSSFRRSETVRPRARELSSSSWRLAS